MAVQSFHPGKLSRRRGSIPGLAILTCSLAAVADKLVAAFPTETPLLLHCLGLPTASPAVDGETPLPPPPPADLPASAPPGHYGPGQGVAAARAVYVRTFRTAPSGPVAGRGGGRGGGRDKLEGTIDDDDDYKDFQEVNRLKRVRTQKGNRELSKKEGPRRCPRA